MDAEERGIEREHHVIDNHRRLLVEHLRSRIDGVDVLRIVSAYFSIYGYELLEEELRDIDSVRLLFGDPDSVADLDPGAREAKAFEITEQGLSPKHVLEQKYLARRCADWVAGEDVEVRSVKRQGFLHGKMYHAERSGSGSAVVGSSNFTRRGLGGGSDPNLEINLAIDEESEDEWMDLKGWFDEIWGDTGRTKDIKAEVLQALARIGKEHAAELIYYKTLFELFRDEIDAQRAGEGEFARRLEETRLWDKLYDFQRDAAKIIIARLERQGGCILADSVGLGKTYTALAVIKHFELRYNARVLVLCPKKLRENWVLYPAANAQVGNPFLEDSFRFTVLSHTDLSRDTGNVGPIDLANFDWSGFHLIVIDESHNFRNATTSRRDEDGNVVRLSRYERLLEEVIARGGDTRVLMLSATPVNTSLTDLRNQIHLLAGKRDDAFRESLGIDSFRNLLGTAQRKFKNWEARGVTREKAALVEDLGVDFFNLLGAVSIARSRRQIKKYYADTMAKIGSFPEHAPPDNRYPTTDLKGELSYRELNERISAFSLAIYNPTAYVTSEKALEELQQEKERYRFNQADRERFLIGMIRTNFLKRLESSARSLSLTLERTIGKIEYMLEKTERFVREGTGVMDADAVPEDEDEDDDFLVNRGRRPFHLGELNVERWRTDLERDRRTLARALKSVEQVTPERDGKLAALVETVRSRVANPTRDKDGRWNRKLLVFTSFKDTAEYLYEQLASVAEELGIRVAMVAGDVVYAPGGGGLRSVLSRFAPRAHDVDKHDVDKHDVDKHDVDKHDEEIDLLIGTDCISEGQNLQDCDTVVNYDIHWNPVRLIQRFGRIDRIGSRAESVRMINYWPTDDMDLYLNLHHRVQARMVLADAAATGDENRLSVEEQVRTELNFRDQQLLRLRDEIGELDDLADGVVMSDFTLDYYLAQLMRYLERFRKQLEETEDGAYAVVDGGRDGVIFVLKQRKAGLGKRARGVSPTSPFFLVFVGSDGAVLSGHMQPKRTLDEFERLSSGKTEPVQALCDGFDAETRQGRDMTRYGTLLDQAVAEIYDRVRASLAARVGERNFRIPKRSEQPSSINDFELVTWLVIRRGEGERDHVKLGKGGAKGERDNSRGEAAESSVDGYTETS